MNHSTHPPWGTSSGMKFIKKSGKLPTGNVKQITKESNKHPTQTTPNQQRSPDFKGNKPAYIINNPYRKTNKNKNTTINTTDDSNNTNDTNNTNNNNNKQKTTSKPINKVVKDKEPEGDKEEEIKEIKEDGREEASTATETTKQKDS